MSETDEQKGGSDDCDVHLHAEIEVLKQALVDKQSQLLAMETACLRESDRQVELEDSIIAWQDKYDRLYESHKRVQKVNQTLEDKLLKLVDRNSGERAQLTSDVATLSVRLAQANYNIAKLQHEIERYKTDINLAIQLLQCKPDSFVPQKVSSLPVDIQSKVSSYMRLETNSHSDSEGSTSGVGLATSGSYKVLPASDSPPPLCPFPPTAMVYSMRGLDAQNNRDCNGITDQMVSPSAMAKYLQDELKASEIKHCDTCNCSPKDLTVLLDEPKSYNVGTQTLVQSESGNSLCLRCNSNLNSPSRTNSPYIMKIVKSSDSVISETKSSVSDLLDNEKLFTPAKKDDLMVNPILGHHRLCDRTNYKHRQQQQLQMCDTAKFILETRKLENEISDLRRFDEKSPKLSPRTEIRNAFGPNISGVVGVESKLSDIAMDVGQGTATILSDIIGDKEAQAKVGGCNLQPVQGTCTSVKSDISDMVGEKKPEHNVQQENGSCHGSHDLQVNNGANAITGSTNSLWSKSSSSEGAKLFENFNRNLIKTIKAENPTHRGPRLCALRIQNGSNNILLDNMDSAITPVVYTRPSRFLDEELDDSKDIITSKISMLMVKRETLPSSTPSQMNALAEEAPLMSGSQLDLVDTSHGHNGVESDNNLPNFVTSVHDENNPQPLSQSTDIYCDAMHAMLHVSNVDSSLDNLKTKELDQQSRPTACGEDFEDVDVCPDQRSGIETGCENLSNFCNNVALHASHYPDQQQYWNGVVLDIHSNQQNKPHYEMVMIGGDNSLSSSFKNTTSKSGTQSSSVFSGAVDIDVQETALLRRQQLTRVAEWVQNNSQQHHDSKLTSLKQFCHDAHNPGYNPNHNAVSRSSMSRNSNISVEKLSISDSASCTAPRPILLNGMHNTLNNNYYHFQRQPHESCNISQDNEIILHHNQRVADSIVHNNYHSCNHNLSTQYKVSGTDPLETTTPTQLSSNDPLELNPTNSLQESRTVDLAQMEYNVKQFLLKQNEWSICNVSNSVSSQKTTNTNSCEIASTAKRTPGKIHLNSSHEKPAIVNNSLPFRTETNL